MDIDTTTPQHDHNSILQILMTLRNCLEQNKQDGNNNNNNNTQLQTTLQTLSTSSTPQFTMNLLAPRLFLPTSSEDIYDSSSSSLSHLSSHDSLSILTYLVSSNPDQYLKPASRAVLSATEELRKDIAAPLEVTDDVLQIIIEQLSGDDVEVTSNASKSIAVLCKRLPPLVTRAMCRIEQTWRSGNSTVSVRCAATVVDLCIQSDAAMEIAKSCGATDRILRMISDESDPLLQMSALDLLETLIHTRPMHGQRARWLFSKPVITELLRLAGGGVEDDDDPDPILGGTALRLLSSTCMLGQRDSSLFGLVGDGLLLGFRRALLKFDLRGELNRLAFIDAVSSFAGASPDAMSLVLDDPVLREGWLSLSVAQPKLKSVVMQSVARVIDPPVETDSNGDQVAPRILSNPIAMHLFGTLGTVNAGDATDLLLSLSRNPIAETRLGAYALMKAVAKRGVGAQVLLSHDGFYDFLIDRERETTKEGKEAKYEIVEAVMKSDVKGLLADNVVMKLEEMLKQGPHYVKSMPWQMATE